MKRLRGAGLDVNTLGDAERLAGRALLLRLKRGLDAVFRDLRQAGRAVRGSRGASAGAARRPAESSAPAFTEAIRDLCITTRHLRYVLGVPLERLDDASALTTAARSANDAHDYDDTLWLERANRLLYDPPGDLRAPPELRAKLDAAAGSLRASLADAFGAASARTRALLDPGRPLAEALGDPELRAAFGALDTPDALDAPYARPIRAVLWDYYLYFEHYDQISFPIFYDTDVGEADVIDVVRVSPEDATALIDERDELERLGPERARRKLAGTALSNFGAFLDRTWRKNDILWGRLDGAERLVSAMLPGAENDGVRAALIEEAHATVLAEEMGADSRGELQRVMGEALLGASMGDPVRQAVEAVLARAQNASPLPTRLRTVLQSALAGDALLPYVRERYAVDRQLDPKPLLRTVARSTQIIGRMFEDLASRQGYEGKRLGWIARLGALFWGLVEIAVPGSLLNLMVRHWFKVLFAFEIFLVVSALLLGSDAVLRFAVTALAVTTLLGLATLILHDWMRLRRGWLRASLGAVAAAVLALAAVGADELFDLGVRQRLCDRVEGVRAGWGQGLCRVVASAQVVAAPAGGGTNAGR